jgi:hypothetical protein
MIMLRTVSIVSLCCCFDAAVSISCELSDAAAADVDMK